MKRFPLLAVVLAVLCCSFAVARDSSTPSVGVHRYTPRVHALINATVITAPGSTLENATIVLRDGLIESVGIDGSVPEDARVWDLAGKIVYPGFIDAYSHFGMPEELVPFVRNPKDWGKKKKPTPEQAGPGYWNPLVTPQRKAIDYVGGLGKTAGKRSDLGFAAVASFPGRGIFRGQGALLSLNGKSANEASIALSVAQHVSFERAESDWKTGEVNYPTSLMGSMALVRQALYDGKWRQNYGRAYGEHGDKLERPVENAALDALGELVSESQLTLFHARDELDYGRIGKLADEFSLKFAILGNGYEYRRLSRLKELGATLVVPVSFPGVPQVERLDQSLDLSLEQLQHWELAPSNLAFLEKEGVEFCITTQFLGDASKEFWKSLRSAVDRGLSEEAALAGLTTNPAKLYDVDKRMGTIASGKIANLVVATGNLFGEDKAKVSEVWIDGDRFEKKAAKAIDLAGEWRFEWDGVDGFLEGVIKDAKGKTLLKVGGETLPLSIQGQDVLLFAKGGLLGLEDEQGVVRLLAQLDENRLTGIGTDSVGGQFRWSATRLEEGEAVVADAEKVSEEDEPSKVPELEFVTYPAGAFGVGEFEVSAKILVKNATIWTSGPEGRLEESDLLIKNGRIAKIGRGLKAPKGAVAIDAAGKHVTAGLIDCHSHVAISKGVNESASASTVEVRIGDVVNPVDINLYRQLAGGLTASNLLHGSANPMGGQNQVIKLRWGEDAEGLKFEGAKPGVKFALGENVKQSNWGDPHTKRYPQTRMGVEQFFRSNLRAAADYERKHREFAAGRLLVPPRRDLRMEATLEILNGERSIHIHSYRQDEILMFARLAAEEGLDVAAFQHILEGYKVADVLADIGAGGSSFADWWAYKFEVYDAIPYNGVLMHEQGVVVSFNSDDAELATRLNTEAAKAVKYGGLSEEEALKFVTL